MECSMTIQGLPLVHFSTPVAAASADQTACVPCPQGCPCPAARRAGGCLLPGAITPVLEAFSPIISYENVLLELRHDGETVVLEETGQRAAFRLLVAAMCQSGCPFFGRTRSVGVGLVAGEDGYGMFRRLVRAMTFPWRDETGTNRLADQSLARCGRDIEAHLQPILAEARRRCRQDAAINAVILMFNCTRLAVEEDQDVRPTAA